MAEGNPQSWRKWMAALDKLELLKPRAVIAGHKRPENEDHPRIIEETRSYFRDFLRLNEETTSVHEFFDRMMKLHGDRANPGSLWGGVTVAKELITDHGKGVYQDYKTGDEQAFELPDSYFTFRGFSSRFL
jgi:hypothetical protein